MALKDWSRLNTSRNVYQWAGWKKILAIQTVFEDSNIVEYQVRLNGKRLKTLKTKTQAIKFSKNYMRKNK